MQDVWTNRAFKSFAEPQRVCVVGLVGPGTESFLPQIVGANQEDAISTAVIYEDAAQWHSFLKRLDSNAERSISAPTICMLRDRTNKNSSTLDRLLKSVNASCFVFTCEPVEMDALSLSLASQHLIDCGSDILQVDLARHEKSGFTFPFVDYLKYRMRMSSAKTILPDIPQTLTNLLIERDSVRSLLEPLMELPPTPAWLQIALIRILAERGVPTSSPLLLGFCDRHARADPLSGGAIVTDPAEREAQFRVLNETAKLVSSLPGEYGNLLRKMYQIHRADCEEILRTTLGPDGVAESSLNSTSAQMLGMLSEATQGTVWHRGSALNLGSIIADHMSLPGLRNMEATVGDVEHSLRRTLHNALAEGRFDASIHELVPMLVELETTCSPEIFSGPVKAEDLALIFFNVKHSLGENQYSSTDLKATLQPKMLQFEAALRDNCTRAKGAQERIANLEHRLAEAELTNLGRAVTAVSIALLGSVWDMLAIPFQVFRIALDALIFGQIAKYWTRVKPAESYPLEPQQARHFTRVLRGSAWEVLALPWKIFCIALKGFASRRISKHQARNKNC